MGGWGVQRAPRLARPGSDWEVTTREKRTSCIPVSILPKRRPVPHDVRQTNLPFSGGPTKASAATFANDALQCAIASSLEATVIGDIVLRLAKLDNGKSAEAFVRLLAKELRQRRIVPDPK
jgi:hypothetical protein